MLSFDDYKKKASKIGTIGQQLKQMSDEVMQETFDNDIQTRQCYIYDYYHDDQADTEYGYNPALSRTKFPVKLKFIVKTYKSMAKDDPEYHIMFEPDAWNSMSCKPDWFDKNYGKLGIEFPVGMMLDIPDDRGVYHRWLIMYLEYANQFVKCGVLRCNYRFQWIENDGVYRHKRQMWGVNSSQSSYTSGKYTDFKMTSFDEQDKFFLPYNQITTELKHDMRLCISMLKKQPWTFEITKVNDTTPKGIITYTVKQTRFNEERDYVQLDPTAPDYGDMYADYYPVMHDVENDNCHITPNTNDNFDCTDSKYNKYTLAIEAINDKVKIGNAKVLYAKVYDGDDNDVTDDYINSQCVWTFSGVNENLITEKQFWLDDEEDHTTLKTTYKFKCKFRFTGDESYMGYNIHVGCKLDNLSSNISLNIVTL